MGKKKEKKEEVSKETDAALAVIEEQEKLEKDVLAQVPQLFEEAQRNLILNETPRYKIKKRKGKQGQVWDYVDVGYILEQLNLLCGHRWDFEILWKTSIEEALKLKQIVVEGRLTLRGKDGQVVTKTQFGCADVKMRTDGSGFLDFGNDMKAAASDCLKKCASQFGVALDVYSGEVKRRQDEKDPNGPITESQRRRLEVLAADAGIGHSGLKALANELFDYTSTKDIQRRHFKVIKMKLEEKLSALVEKGEHDIPDDVDALFDILGTPPAKRIASWRAYSSKDMVEELVRRLNQEIDKRNSEGKKGADGGDKSGGD